MAHFNECSQLIDGVDKAQAAYDSHIAKHSDPLQVMLDMQKSLQVRLAKDREYCYHPDKLETAGDVVSWMREQKDSIDDEFRELLTSLGEMSLGEKEASAVWKKWKARYKEAQEKRISDMSDKDQLEIKFEMIDILHFVLNMFIALGLDAEEIFKLYYLKNKHNFERQNNGY